GWPLENLAGSGILQDLLDGGVPEVDVAQAVLAEGLHAQLHGLLLDHHRRGTFGDQLADWIRDVQELIETTATLVTGLAAGRASPTREEVLVPELVGSDAQLVENAFARLVGSLAVLADRADQT